MSKPFIRRDGTDFLLTPEEIKAAHDWYRLTNDICEIETVFDHLSMDDLEIHYGITSQEEYRDRLAKAAVRMRHFVEEESTALPDALRIACEEIFPVLPTEKTLVIPRKKLDRFNALMNADSVDYEQEGIERYATVEKWTVPFHAGYEVDVKVCSGHDGSPLWCEAVLFKNGSEVSCTEAESILDGEFVMWVEADAFTVHVSDKQDETEQNKAAKKAPVVAGVFIDPANGIAEKREIVGDGLQPYYDLLRCEYIEMYTRYIGHSSEPFIVFCSDNGDGQLPSAFTSSVHVAFRGPIFICGRDGEDEVSLNDTEMQYVLMHLRNLSAPLFGDQAKALVKVDAFPVGQIESLVKEAEKVNPQCIKDMGVYQMLLTTIGPLRAIGDADKAEELKQRIFHAESAEEAAKIFRDYVHFI